MRNAIVAALAAAVALVAASMIGVASAEAPSTTTPVRTISVEGVATVAISQNASQEEADAIYRQGMAAALSDGQSKAEFLAGKAGVTLGQVQSLVEDGGGVYCTASGEGYASYEGEQPDFGYARSDVVAPEAEAAPQRAVGPTTAHRVTAKKHKPEAKKATAGSCKLEAEDSIVYAID